jgi:hypothetical protein
LILLRCRAGLCSALGRPGGKIFSSVTTASPICWYFILAFLGQANKQQFQTHNQALVPGEIEARRQSGGAAENFRTRLAHHAQLACFQQTGEGLVGGGPAAQRRKFLKRQHAASGECLGMRLDGFRACLRCVSKCQKVIAIADTSTSMVIVAPGGLGPSRRAPPALQRNCGRRAWRQRAAGRQSEAVRCKSAAGSGLWWRNRR